jgi:cysteine desulfurase
MSTNPRIYLDFNATAPLGADVRAAMTRVMEDVGNPSSVHTEGRRARDHVERARDQVARLLGRPREQVVFTSGGTEGNTLGVLALAAAAERRGLPRVIAAARIDVRSEPGAGGGSIDHPSLRGAVEAVIARGWRLATIGVTGDGALMPASLDGVGLLALSAVNHELGTVADAGVVAAARAAGALVHVDAVQAAGKQALSTIAADSIVISAHKLGGPQGVGALAIAVDDGLPLIDGGHQERGRRPGTENVLGIVGMGAAAAGVHPGAWPAVAALGERLEAGLRAMPGVRIHGAGAPRVGGTVNAGFAGARGESIVIGLDLAGVAVSTGAACTSGTVRPSPVLLALGMSPEQAREAVRFSLGRTTTAGEIDAVLARLPAIVERARAHRA